jgi:hypothetical protein
MMGLKQGRRDMSGVKPEKKGMGRERQARVEKGGKRSEDKTRRWRWVKVKRREKVGLKKQ